MTRPKELTSQFYNTNWISNMKNTVIEKGKPQMKYTWRSRTGKRSWMHTMMALPKCRTKGQRWEMRKRSYETRRTRWKDSTSIHHLRELRKGIIRRISFRIVHNWWKTPISRFRKLKDSTITENQTYTITVKEHSNK